MFSLLASIVLGLSAIGTGVVPTYAKQNEITIENSVENLTNIQWHNNRPSISKDEESLSLFEKYGVDSSEAANSLDVYIQEEYIPFEEIIPAEYLTNELGISTLEIGDTQSSEYVHNKGYVKFTTVAYAVGFYDGNIVYHIQETVEQQKKFTITKNDNLIIRHGDNAATLNLDAYPTSGLRTTPFSDALYTYYDYESLSPNYSCAEAGVYYTFYATGNSILAEALDLEYGLSTITADYYMVATDTTEVQPVYVHDYNIFVSSVSISFGVIGASISAGTMTDVMEGSTMTLKAYSERIYHETYTLNPADWGFDARYYFKNEGIKTKTITIDDITITTKRLRCGYIEEEYINLSPNRYDAGDAYLELTFGKPIYELSTYVSFWSKYENLSSSGDYAYIQYLDEDGEWQNYVDLLALGISTDRTSQTHVECDFIEGTYGIKFVAHKETPDTDRNKGRICIGTTKFVTYAID